MRKVLIETEELFKITYVMEVPDDGTVQDAEESLWRGNAEEFDCTGLHQGAIKSRFITNEEMMKLHKLTRIGQMEWDFGTVEEILVNPWRGTAAYFKNNLKSK